MNTLLITSLLLVSLASWAVDASVTTTPAKVFDVCEFGAKGDGQTFDTEAIQQALIEGVTVLAPEGAANTDGIDPSNCRNVTITRCVIDVGDDNIAIKSGKQVAGRDFGCDGITVTDCIFKHGHGMSIGSETVGGVRNVLVKNCTFEDTDNGLRIKSRRERSGIVENITYTDCTLTNCHPAI